MISIYIFLLIVGVIGFITWTINLFIAISEKNINVVFFSIMVIIICAIDIYLAASNISKSSNIEELETTSIVEMVEKDLN